jgi:hypothetical protein
MHLPGKSFRFRFGQKESAVSLQGREKRRLGRATLKRGEKRSSPEEQGEQEERPFGVFLRKH